MLRSPLVFIYLAYLLLLPTIFNDNDTPLLIPSGFPLTNFRLYLTNRLTDSKIRTPGTAASRTTAAAVLERAERTATLPPSE